MKSDGKQLEALVAFVERKALPLGVKVEVNDKVYEDGIQVAEFDIVVTGRIGTTDMKWLIECRDRPSQGKAPGEWIEQLAGRRRRFGFSHVTAVSTTGFSENAKLCAKDLRIELREVAALEPSQFEWLLMREMQNVVRRADLKHVALLVDDQDAHLRTLKKFMALTDTTTPFLRSTVLGNVTAHTIFAHEVNTHGFFDGLNQDGDFQEVEFTVEYTNDQDHYVVDKEAGPLRIRRLMFQGELSLVSSRSPLARTEEYRRTESGEPISQVASFAPLLLSDGLALSLELHKIEETGQTHVLLRTVKNESEP